MKRLVVCFSRFSPYHLARLDAAGARLRAEGIEVVGVEVADHDRENPWDTEAGARAFRRRTLFPGSDYPGLAPRQIVHAFQDLLREEDPLAVVLPGWAFPEALAGLRWCRRQRRPAILMSESGPHDSPRHAWREALKARLVRQFAAGLVGGRAHAAYASTLGLAADRIFTGYDVVDNEHFARGAAAARANATAQRQRLGLPPRFFLASCRFIPRKNVARLLDAYAAYRAACTTPAAAWDLVICGDGPQREALAAQVQALGLADTVRFPGFVGYRELPAYYGLAAAFVHVSESEQWGLVVNEAMAAGLPVLVSRACGCAAELVAEGRNGFTVAAEDIAAMTDALRRLAADTTDRAAMGEASRARMAAFTPAQFAVGLASALARAQTAPPPPARALDTFVLRTLCPG